MKALNPLTVKRSGKDRRKRKVLMGLVDHFIRTGKPVGSSTLKEDSFQDLSSATIRNYFATLEEEGYLVQQHISGGRIPTALAYRTYAQEVLDENLVALPDYIERFQALHQEPTKEIARYLQQAADLLGQQTNMAVFLSAPRFDHDFVIDIKVVRIDPHRCVCLLITEFGVIQTVVLHSEIRLSNHAAKRLEAYFQWRLNGIDKPEHLEAGEEELGQHFYNEVMLRYIVSYSNFIDEEIYRTGFSKLLAYPEFRDAHLLANSLALFENAHSMRLLLRECSAQDQLKFWIGEDLIPYSHQPQNCAVLAVPFRVNQNPVGAVGILGPMRVPYQELFGALQRFSELVTDTLTKSLYKFKIKHRQPESGRYPPMEDVSASNKLLIDHRQGEQRNGR